MPKPSTLWPAERRGECREGPVGRRTQDDDSLGAEPSAPRSTVGVMAATSTSLEARMAALGWENFLLPAGQSVFVGVLVDENRQLKQLPFST